LFSATSIAPNIPPYFCRIYPENALHIIIHRHACYGRIEPILTGTAELAQAVLEGVALGFAQGQRVIEHAGVKIDTVAVIGGGARSTYWGEILATILQRSLIYRQQAGRRRGLWQPA